MKKITKKILLSVSTILLSLAIFFTGIHYYRYHVSSPMMDIEYKKQILKDSHNLTYRLENLRPIVGEQELTEFIKNNDNNPKIYTPSTDNIKNGEFRANFHMHTTNSDGKNSVENYLNMAQNYSQKNIKNGYMYIAITDHNTVLGTQEIIKILQKNPKKYNKIKIIPGIEVFSAYNNSKYSKTPLEIHVLTWCINPYDKELNKEFYKKDLKDKLNRTNPDRDFDLVISMMSKYGLVGIAHPLRYVVHLKDKKYPYIDEMFKRYKNLTNKTLFTEGYYQTYHHVPEKAQLGNEYNKFLNYINYKAKSNGIYRTGSTDAHGYSIFTK